MGIRRKLVLSNSLIILFTILLVAVPSIYLQTKELRNEIRTNTEQEMEISFTKMSGFFGELYKILSTSVAYVCNNEFDYKTCTDTFIQAIKGNDKILCLYYVDTLPMKKGGKFYSSDYWVPEDDYDKNTRDWYSAAKKSNGYIITEPYVDPTTNELVTTVATAVRENGAFTGVVALDILLTDMNEIVSALKISDSCQSFLLDANGVYLTNPDIKKVMESNFFTENPQFNELKVNTSYTTYVNLNAGKKYYYASKQINESGWQLVTMGHNRELYTDIQRNVILMIIMALIGQVFAMTVVLIVSTRIVNPITTVDNVVNEIAQGNADLTQRLVVKSDDEVGSLVAGFNKFVEKLQTLVSEIKASKDDLGSVEKDLQSSVSDAASSITEILSNIESIGNQVGSQVNAVNQTSAAVAEIAENINSLERMIEKQSNGVSQASSAVEEMIGNINAVSNNMNHMAESFSELERTTEVGIQRQHSVAQQVAEVSEQSKTLQEANKAIASVASQTNLLAMNAAIEAAHAGEAGRGFAVVADEIRKLSETSSAQSKRIGSELKQIQQTISAVVASSQESTQSFNDVSNMIQSTAQLVQQIRGAMEEQQEGSKQIVDSLKVMNDSTVEVRTAGHEMAQGNQLILDEVHHLQDTTLVIKESMQEMSAGAKSMNGTSSTLSEISGKVNDSIMKIGSEIDQFKV